MDGGTQEKDMAEAIKHQIKDNAIGRRERQEHDQGASTGSSTPFIVTSQDTFMSENEGTQPAGTRAEQPSTSPNEQSAATERVKIATSFVNPASSSSRGSIDAPKTSAEAWELEFIMIYMDHVFPFLFPFYQPPLVGTSRAWLLTFVKQNDSVFHSVISLSSFFFTIGHKDIFGERLKLCRWTLWEQVSKQAKMAFETIQNDIEKLNTESGPPLLRKAQMMETILQLLIFEQFVGNSDGWKKHLDTALDLFEDILHESPSPDATGSVLDPILNKMQLPGPQVVGFEKVLWNAHQAAFRFFTAILIHFDVIASTSLGRPPRLHQYHHELLGELPVHEIGTPLNLAHFVGCHNSVIRTIGDISALDSWKKEMAQSLSLSNLELLKRGMPLFETLRSLENLCRDAPDMDGIDTWHFMPYYRSPSQLATGGLEKTANQIWIHAARIYLSVVLFGWKPTDKQIMNDVKQGAQLLKTVDSPAQIRALSWPICVIGCMGEDNPDADIVFSIHSKVGESQLFSSIRDAGNIVVNATSDSDFSYLGPDRDFAACFRNMMGNPALLI